MYVDLLFAFKTLDITPSHYSPPTWP